MIVLLIKLVLFIIAGICKAVVDTIIHHSGGILRKKWGKFFDVNVQGKMLPFIRYPVDGQHVFNSAMMVCFSAAAALQAGQSFIGWLILFLVYGFSCMIIFNIFWNRVLN